MKRVIYIFCACLLTFACKQQKKESEVSNTNKNETLKVDSVKHVSIDITLNKTIDLPLGFASLTSYTFPELWSYESIFSENETSINKNTQELNRGIEECTKIIKNNIYNFDYSIIKHTKHTNSISRENNDYKLSQVIPIFKNYNLLLVSNIQNTLASLIFLNKNKEVVDNIDIFYNLSGDLHTKHMLFYIDKNYEIYTKEFQVYDDATSSSKLKKYIISPITGEINLEND